MRRYIFLIFLLIVQKSLAQYSGQWETLKTQYPDEAAVFVERSETVTLQVKGDSLHLYTDTKEDILHLKEQSDYLVNRKVYGSHFTEVADIKAKTLVWEKNKHRELSVTNISRKHDSDDAIFYDDSYYYALSFPAVAPGNRTHLEYRNKIKDARFLPGFLFASYLPQNKVTFTIKASAGVQLVYNTLHDPEGLIKFKEYSKGGWTFYEWTAEKLNAVKIEESSPSIRYFSPHVVYYVKSFKTSNGSRTVLSSPADLYQWYYSFVSDLNKELSPELKDIVSKLTAPGDSEQDIVRKVFYWVQDNIRYIAFEEGMRGLIPHHASYVCEKRYGDCKDMANLIVSMLREAGVKAYHTWIGTRDLPYKYSDLPSPLVDNHMIATYISPDKKYYFLDATSNHTPFGLPSSMIQGKEALIGLGPEQFEIKLVPEVDREINRMKDSLSVMIKGNELLGIGKVSLKGYPKVFGGYRLDRVKEEETRKYVTRLVSKGSNKFYLDTYNIDNLYEREKPTYIDYNYRIGDYFQRIGDEIYINLNLNKTYYNEYINVDLRKSPKENEYRYLTEEVVSFVIPDGYEPEYIPADARHEGKELGFSIRYEQQPGQIILRKEFYIDYLILGTDKFSHWNESVKKISEAYKESIILKKK